ncbi:hypothetical protein BSCA_0377 [Bifidobacterium scardovii]|uniref:Uncharacterized protein n=1 Tax=Bifidobacterium scardovii TaxID=158787 RepID=A0A087D3E0_9BIFI|nr:hypothetical protein BSCA_0377 [Bifidobacterium scardovii]
MRPVRPWFPYNRMIHGETCDLHGNSLKISVLLDIGARRAAAVTAVWTRAG